jgi:hypothetical protein
MDSRRGMVGPGVSLVAGAVLAIAAVGPARAGNSWALPLIGGALGGYALHSLVQSRSAPPAPLRHHAASRPAAHASQRAATPEARLQQLDQLAAKGLITPAEYQQRRQAILDAL